MADSADDRGNRPLECLAIEKGRTVQEELDGLVHGELELVAIEESRPESGVVGCNDAPGAGEADRPDTRCSEREASSEVADTVAMLAIDTG